MVCSENGFRTEISLMDGKITHKTVQNNLLGPQNALGIFKIHALNMALWAILHVCTISLDITDLSFQENLEIHKQLKCHTRLKQSC